MDDNGCAIAEKRAKHFNFFCSLMPEVVSRMGWSRAQIDEFRTQALQELLQHARANSRWHAARLPHIDLSAFSIADLANIPSMTKNDLMANWDQIVTVPGASLGEAEERLRNMADQFYIWGDHVLFGSGGTGGRPGIFLYDWEGLALNWAGMARSIRPYTRSLPLPGRRVLQPVRTAAIGAEVSAHGSFVVGRVFSDPDNPIIRLSGWRAASDLVPKLNAVQPEFLVCYPSLIPALAAAARVGELRIRPQVLLCGGEYFPQENQELARTAWPDTNVITCWGTSEAGGTFPCPCGDGFHISEDQVIIEAIDNAGSPIAPGQRSAGIYLTNLYNKAQPIIRYFIDDVFELADGPCACGCAFQKVRQVHGRNFERFHYGTITVHPVTLQMAVLEQPAILEYQFRQTPRGAHLAYRSVVPVDNTRLTRRMREALNSYGLQNPDISVVQVAVLERTGAGKLKRFVPLTR